jgi:peptidoglycan/LPS O-acetylase OafA/YrhL
MRQQNQLIEGLRLLCSFLVVGSHLAPTLDSANFPAADEVYNSIGPTMVYMFRGSAVYFFLISGFILAAKLPEWRAAQEGLIHHMAKRITRLLFVFWAALVVVTLCNLIKQWIYPPAWVPVQREAWLAEFTLSSAATGQKLRMIPPAWYLEVDLLLILGTCAVYLLWCDLSPRIKRILIPFLAVLTVAITLGSLRVEAMFAVEANPSFSYFRSIGYFILGLLAWHSRTRLMALVCLIIISVSYIAFDDHTEMRKYYCNTGRVLVAWILACSHHHPTLKLLFEKYPIQRLSKISFSLFLTHYLVLTVWISFARHLTPKSVPAFCGFMLMSLPVMYLVAWLFHTIVETRVIAFHRWLWSATPAMAAAPAPDTQFCTEAVQMKQS